MRALPLLLLGLAALLGGCRTRLTALGPPPSETIDAAREAAIETYPWPEHVTAEERARIEEALHTVFEVGGREGREAEAFLVDLDHDTPAAWFRAVGRIVTEMKHTIDRHGLEGYEGMSRIMVLDRMLRRLDGVQERVFGEEYGLDIDEPPSRALRLVRTWNWWYREGRFLTRYRPWDPRVDMVDPPEPD